MESREDLAIKLRPQLVGQILKISRCLDDAEDSVQEAYVKILPKLNDPSLSLDDEQSMGRFLTIVTRNTYYDMMRKRKRANTEYFIEDDWDDPNGMRPIPELMIDRETPEAILIAQEHNERVAKAFKRGTRKLPKPHRELIKALVAGESQKEYADRKGEPCGTVSFRSWCARQHIKKALQTFPLAGD